MLWYKAWLETRWRVLFLLGFMFFLLFQVYGSQGFPRQKPAALSALAIVGLLVPLMLAGSGIRPESPFRAVKGLQGSMYFTLSLPVSRLRLSAVRTGLALVETAGVIAVGCLAAGALPEIRAHVTPGDGLRYAIACFVCCLPALGISTLLATFLDQQWQMFGSMFVFFLARQWLLAAGGAIHPSRFNFFQAMGPASPLVTHTLPLAAMGAAFGIAVICLLAAAKIEQSRQF